VAAKPTTKTVFICSSCGYDSAKWNGKCPSCGTWNSMNEETIRVSSGKSTVSRTLYDPASARAVLDIHSENEQRYTTGFGELDRVLGGGIVQGALMLIGGDPGIGKSTLLLQVCGNLERDHSVLYVTGEESARQIKLRADRLGVKGGKLFVLCETDIDTILEHMRGMKPDVVVIDSIQTMSLDMVSSSAGSVTQVRECTSAIMKAAKSADIPVFIIGHVNKDGAIAGPKVMEHIVDCVLYFEGERHTSYRILRCIKNRYGSTNEIGVFDMADSGLAEVQNPSMMLLSGRPVGVSGTCVACTMEGTRPLLAEVQGLVSPTGFGNPRRMATGFDYNRLSLLLAVLEKRGGYFFSNLDAYINIIGGLKLDEPAADLPVALSLISSLKDKPVLAEVVAIGEIGLAGELRAVTNIASRINEAARLGFKKIILPAHGLKETSTDIEIIAVKNLQEAFTAAIG